MNYETDLRNPIDITIENKTNINQAIRYFDCNFQDILEPGDTVILTATSSERLAYYTKIKEELEKDATPDGFFSKQLVQDVFDAFLAQYQAEEHWIAENIVVNIEEFNKTSDTEATFTGKKINTEYKEEKDLEGTIQITDEDKVRIDCEDYYTGFHITCNKDLSELDAQWIEN